jgi:hypothetical protein
MHQEVGGRPDQSFQSVTNEPREIIPNPLDVTRRYARSQAITTIDDTGSLSLSKNPLIAKAFSQYDPKRTMTIGEISLDGSCAEAFWDLHTRSLGTPRLAGSSGSSRAGRNRCGPSEYTASPDQLYVAAIRDEQSQAELSFGALTVCNAVVLQTETLQVRATIALSKHTTWHSLAVWHGKGQLRAAASDESPVVKIYFASDSVRNSKSNLLQ